MKRLHLLLALFLVGCVSATAKSQSDQIDLLVQKLSNKYSLWKNGLSPNLKLPSTTKPELVVSRIFESISFDKGKVNEFEIIKIKYVSIPPEPENSKFTAVLVKTNLGTKILLFRYESVHWWSRVYDTKA